MASHTIPEQTPIEEGELPRDVFFYGLFMDVARLRAQGLDPRVLARARLEGYELRIGRRASLVPRPGATSYGLVLRLQEAEVAELYSESSVADYTPEEVTVAPLDGGPAIRALCYILPPSALGEESNAEYASELARVAEELGFPADYVSGLQRS